MNQFFLFLAFALMVAVIGFTPGEIERAVHDGIDWARPQTYYVIVE